MRHPAGLPAPLAELHRPIVMGVLNVTPDSFSDGGRYLDAEDAVAHGLALHVNGADLVDVGGESTRPGAVRVSPTEEQQRVLAVVRGLVDAGVPVSIDTMHASTAAGAVEAGAILINDVSGGRADPAMYRTIADLGVPCVLMHWRAHGAVMDTHAHYDDVVQEVCAELTQVRDAAVAAGVESERIVLDPGLGFAKDSAHNWAILRDFDALLALGHPILVGASRKRFLGALLAKDGVPRALDARDDASDAVAAIAVREGAWGVRVHRVHGAQDAVAVGWAWRRGHE
jgi:dihydropteroate synthase